MTGTPEWIRSQRRARGECELCGQRSAETQWGQAGPLLCWPCCEARQAAYSARYDEGGMSEYRPTARPGGAVVAMTGERLAQRYWCQHRDVVPWQRGFHSAGNGKPRSKRCTYCRGPFVTEFGLWGVFGWRGDGRYPREAAERTFTRELAAEDWRLDHAGAGNSLVVRWIHVDTPAGARS